MRKAFTLAEVLIVLVVIGVLSAVLLPVARKGLPNQNVLKFKKAHNALLSAVKHMVSSDIYYYEGDLGIKYDKTPLIQDAPENRKYFCNTLADVLTTKEVNCSDKTEDLFMHMFSGMSCETVVTTASFPYACNGSEIPDDIMETNKLGLDWNCKHQPYRRNVPMKQIVTPDNAWFYDPGPNSTFGRTSQVVLDGEHRIFRVFSSPSKRPDFYDAYGRDVQYKIFCMDIDGVPENATEDDCVNECPFGYGIRADGHVLIGARADEWLEKTIQEE